MRIIEGSLRTIVRNKGSTVTPENFRLRTVATIVIDWKLAGSQVGSAPLSRNCHPTKTLIARDVAGTDFAKHWQMKRVQTITQTLAATYWRCTKADRNLGKANLHSPRQNYREMALR
jgi:hypothetical protein